MTARSLAFIGGGRMARAIIAGLRNSGDKRALRIADVSAEALKACQELAPEARLFPDASSMLDGFSGAILLAVKPQQAGELLAGLRGPSSENVFVSIVAGFGTARLEEALGPGVPVVRAMPNTPALVGEAITALCPGRYAGPEAMTEAEEIFRTVGAVVVMEEKDFDLVTAVSGSGPAYFFLLMKELFSSAERLGLPREAALQLVLRTAAGAALLARERIGAGETFDDLIASVASKGGTTEAALKVFKWNRLDHLVENAVSAAAARSRELAKA